MRDTQLEEMYRQLHLAADEYMSFRGQMMCTPMPTGAQVQEALMKADRIMAVLRIIRGKEAMTPLFVPLHEPGTVLAVGTARNPDGGLGAPTNADGSPLPPCSAWQCPSCNEVLWVIGSTRPRGCPCCGIQFQF
jgi:hypothetical protein